MKVERINEIILTTLSMLPQNMDSKNAHAYLIALGLQESRFEHRCQVLNSGGRGPAHGFWQFEQGGGITAVLGHYATRSHIRTVLAALGYSDFTATGCWTAVEHNDILACAFARLLLWSLPGSLAGRSEPDKAWAHYLDAWRPGKPHRETWNAYYAQAWELLSFV